MNHKLFMAGNEVTELIRKHANCQIRMKSLKNDSEIVIHAVGCNFPLDVINTGDPTSSRWDGEPSVLKRLREIEDHGIQFEMQERTIGDETAYKDIINQDFKLVLSVKY